MRIYVGLIGSFLLLAGCSSGSTDTPTNDGGNNTDPDGGNHTDPDGGNNNGAFTCSTGSLFAGNPVYDGDPGDRPTSGTGIKADPPLQWQTLVFSGTHLFTRQESEIWDVDVSASSPVETRIVGATPKGSTYDFKTGACSAASFSQLRGIAALPDGSLVASDYFANAIVKISNPSNSATCTVTPIAGSVGPLLGLDPSTPSTLPKGGNADGAGAAATFNEPTAMTTDSAGSIYVADIAASNGAALIRKIDASGNVTTLAKLGTNSGAPTGLTNFTTIGTTLYAAARDLTNSSYILQIDTTSGKITTILSGNADTFPPAGSGTNPGVSGIATDGKGLIVAGPGYVWYVTLAGKLSLLAGTGNSIDYFPNGYDPKASHPALSLALPTALGPSDEHGTGSFNHIAFYKGAVYYRGHANGTAAFVEKISCP
ncbi:hypothetical protein BH09MYX1_BH09MYX1_36230 [soil metagenome]